ncbi:MAG: pilus assembly protein, partial [Pseudomonadota bacterium]
QPHDISKAKMRISSLEDDNGTVKVVWSKSCNGMGSWNTGRVVTIPNNLIPSGGTLVMAEIEYPYSSSLGFFFTAEKTLSDTFYLRPRRVESITRVEGGGVSCGS